MARRKASKKDNEIVAKLIIWIIISPFLFIYALFYLVLKLGNKKNNTKNNTKKKSININNDLRSLTKYDSYFPSYIRSRGIEYYNGNKVIDFKCDDKHCTAKVFGTHVYESSAFFNNDGSLKYGSCTCPYFSKDGKYCKHIYAVLLEYSNYNKDSKVDDSQEYHKEIVYDYSAYPDNDIDEIDEELYEDLGIVPIEEEYEDDDLKSFWGLNDEEAELVKKGDYDPWDFEEEDLEEDDYYYEDD